MYTAPAKTADLPQADRYHAPPLTKSMIPEKTAITGQALDKDRIKPEKHIDKTKGCKPARLRIDTQNVLPADQVAKDNKSKCPVGPSIEHLGLSSDSSDEEQPNANQKVSVKVCVRPTTQTPGSG